MKKTESTHLPALFIQLIKKNLVGFFAFLLLWEILSLIFPAYIIPSPWLIIRKIPEFLNQEFVLHLQISLFRLLTGFVSAFLIATFIGIAAYKLTLFEYTENILSLFQVIPGAILGIIFLIIFGVGNNVPIAMIIVMSIPIMAINTSTGLRKIVREQEEVVYIFGGGTLEIVRYVYIPVLVPVFRSNILIGTGLALKVIVLGEYIGCENGVGFLLSNAQTLFRMDMVFFYLMVIMTIALIFQIIVNFLFVELFRKYLD
ncbi:MAG: ABC transporter permease subunit [Candidatus Cloacimonetes bacterium]|nr:ABC transporter permease subunit [Candidatus Cloacimonadota bacterium]